MTAQRLPRDTQLHALWIALFVAAFAQTLVWLFERWTASVYANVHGLSIALLSGWLVFENLRRDPIRTPQSSPLGFLFVVPGLALLTLDSVIRSDLLGAVGLVIALPGLSLLLLGTERTRKLAFPLLLSVFALPLPFAWLSPVHWVLRVATAWATERAIALAGLPIMRDGVVLHMPTSPVEIAEACSGYSAMFGAVTLAMVLAYLGRSRPRRVLILVAAPVIAFVGNVLRSIALVLLVQWYGAGILETPIHQLSGIVAFAVTLALIFALAERDALRSG
jgi:exosortase